MQLILVSVLIGDIAACITPLHSIQIPSLFDYTIVVVVRIPADISGCLSLRNLLLFDNQLSGNLPPELGKISSLEVIRVGGNKDIVGKIPDEFGDLSNLTVLGVTDTGVSGSLPSNLAISSMERFQAICARSSLLKLHST